MRALVGIFAAAAWLAAPGRALANDASFSGAGADLVPLTRNDVAMRSEDIVLTARGTDWDVRARYVFFNHAAGAVTLQVGFPEYRCDAEDSGCANVAFHDLVTKVEGKAVVHRSGKLDKRHTWAPYLGNVWLFDVEFPAQREVVIEHQYSLTSGSDVMDNLFTSYVTRTGASWKGSIGSARFTAILPPHTHTVYNPDIAGATVHAPRLVLDDAPHVELVVEARDWTPRGEVYISFNASARMAGARLAADRKAWQKPPVSYDALFRPADCMSTSEPAPETAQDCKNLIYASKGYAFKTKALSERFYAGGPDFQLVKTDLPALAFWVRTLSALPSFSVTSFDAWDRMWLDKLEAIGKLVPGAAAANSGALSWSPPVEQQPVEPTPASDLSGQPAAKAPVKAGRQACACRTTGGSQAPVHDAAAVLLSFIALVTRRRRR